MKKTYLGDGVYVDLVRGDTILLTTEDGVRATNEIYLEPEVYHALVEFVGRARLEVEVPAEAPEMPPDRPVGEEGT